MPSLPARACATLFAIVLGASAFARAAGAADAFALPNASLTPGAIGAADGASVDAAAVCTRGYAKRARHAYDPTWRRYRSAIFLAYGIPHALWSRYTVDHLIPIELGGRPFGIANGRWDLRNVWPEPKADAKRKDAVEDALHAAVCYRRGYRGLHLSLADAERAIARNWTQTPVGLPVRRLRNASLRSHHRSPAARERRTPRPRC